MACISMKCLSEYANVRLTYFTDIKTKSAFIANFCRNLIEFFKNPQPMQPIPHHVAIFSNIRVYRESLRLIHKFALNFTISSILNCQIDGILENFLQGIFQYNLEALLCNLPNKKQLIIQYMSYMNQAWQRMASGVRYNQIKDGKEELVE